MIDWVLISCIKHKEKPSVYGQLVMTGGAMYFLQWKWPRPLPERKPTDPDRTTSVSIRSKAVDESIWDSFQAISVSEFCEIESMDMIASW